MPACHRMALSNICQLSPHPSRKSPPTEERVPAPLRWSPYCLDYPLLDNVQNNRGQLCVVVTSLDRSQTLESLQKVSSLGRLRNECLHFSRFFFFGFFFSGYSLGHSRSCLSLQQFPAVCRDFGS